MPWATHTTGGPPGGQALSRPVSRNLPSRFGPPELGAIGGLDGPGGRNSDKDKK